MNEQDCLASEQEPIACEQGPQHEQDNLACEKISSFFLHGNTSYSSMTASA
jgi:hypothetical protein